MKVILNNGYSFYASYDSTSDHIASENADITRMTYDAFKRMEFCSDDLLNVYGRYENTYPSVTNNGTYYEWVDGVLSSDIPQYFPEQEQTQISIEERVNDLEMAVCELYDSIVEA